MYRKALLLAVSVFALFGVEYFAVNTAAYAVNEMTKYQVAPVVVLITWATVILDIFALAVFASKDPEPASGYLMAAWFLVFTLRAGLVLQGLIFRLEVLNPELVAIAPVPVALVVWLLNVVAVWLAGKAIKMPVEQPDSPEP